LASFVAVLALPRALANVSLLMLTTVDQRGFGVPYRANQLEAAYKILRGETVPDLLLVTLFPNRNEREKVQNWRETGADPAALTRARLKRIKAELMSAAGIYPYDAVYYVYTGKVDSWLAPFEGDPVHGWDSAISRFEKAVELNPWSYYWRVLLGQACLERSALGDRRYYQRKALDEFRQAVENYPTNPESLRHLGTALVYVGERTKAESCFQRARELEERARLRRERALQ
jgi:tetratricopeptide (TPR) repeat protein